jgi:hypothetical protein
MPSARFSAAKCVPERATPRGGRGRQWTVVPLPTFQLRPPYSGGQRGWSSLNHVPGSLPCCAARYQRCRASKRGPHSPQARSKRASSRCLNFTTTSHRWQSGTAFSGRESRQADSAGMPCGIFKAKRHVAFPPQRVQVSRRCGKVPFQGRPATDAACSSSRYTASASRICRETSTAPRGTDHLPSITSSLVI